MVNTDRQTDKQTDKQTNKQTVHDQWRDLITLNYTVMIHSAKFQVSYGTQCVFILDTSMSTLYHCQPLAIADKPFKVANQVYL